MRLDCCPTMCVVKSPDIVFSQESTMESMEGLMVVNEMARDAVFHMLMEDGIHVWYMDTSRR